MALSLQCPQGTQQALAEEAPHQQRQFCLRPGSQTEGRVLASRPPLSTTLI